LENLTWKIDNSRINIEVAQWIIEVIEMTLFRKDLNLISRGIYKTFSEDIKFQLVLHDNYWVCVTDIQGNMVHYGMYHVMKDKLLTLYPVLRKLAVKHTCE
jgi:hypothetical protein